MLLLSGTRAAEECQCEHCVDVLGQSVADCQSLGLDCACLLDCKCQHCVVVLGQTVAACTELGLDCTCYHGTSTNSGEGTGAGGSCDLSARTTTVNDECCDEPTEDCSGGRPHTCNAGCESRHRTLPVSLSHSASTGSPLDVAADCAQVRACSCPSSPTVRVRSAHSFRATPMWSRYATKLRQHL
jgi:hypothetical protein